MLDNVKQLAQEPADNVSPPPQFMTSSPQQQSVSQFTPTPAPAQTYGSPTPQQDQTNSDQTDDSDASAQDHTSVAEPAQGFSSSPMPDPVASTQESDADEQQTGEPEETAQPEPDNTYQEPIAATPMSFSTPADPQQLAGMKQQALDHLEPLVDHLDQSPEESFKTTMMMIQANDNHTLLEKALEQAKKIEDDKLRANAMLDIINEINYFSQSSQE
jgi:hypothetical protein